MLSREAAQKHSALDDELGITLADVTKIVQEHEEVGPATAQEIVALCKKKAWHLGFEA